MVVADDPRPVSGHEYPRTYQGFRSWFPDELTSDRAAVGPGRRSKGILIGTFLAAGNDWDEPTDD